MILTVRPLSSLTSDIPSDHRITAPNLAELYRRAADQFGDLPAFATRNHSDGWTPVSFRKLYRRGLYLATGLIELGVNARDHVGHFGDNRLEWILADYAVQIAGAADVPRGRDVTDHELIYIINHSRMRIAFVETTELQEAILRLRLEFPGLKEVILLDPGAEPGDGFRSLKEVEKLGEELRDSGDRRAEERMSGIQPDDLFTLIYTSGTTGRPKGVMLTHRNMMSQTSVIPVSLSFTDRVLSLLPIWHIFERVFEVYTISSGTCTYYSSIRTLGEDLKQVEPTFMGSAPRLWESLHQRILKGVQEAHPMRRLLFHTAYFLSHYYKSSLFYLTQNDLQMSPGKIWKRLLFSLGHSLRLLLILPWYGFFNAAVLEPIRMSAGGSLKATISGGGALPGEIDRFFNYIGIPVLEGYGMTETSPVIAVRTVDRVVIGTVGPLVAGTEIRIVDLETGEILFPNTSMPDEGRCKRGEIRVRGPQVMKGYYREPERSGETVVDGWLRTGDIGMVTFNNCLKILGRSKSTVVLTSGENLEPEPIELWLRQSPYIENCMIVGQDQKYISALIVPDPEEFRKRGVDADSLESLAASEKAYEMIRSEAKRIISRANGFKSYEQIHDVRLLPEKFEVGRELTNLYKLKRHVIHDKYETVITEMYQAKQ
ncbi:MAG: long-chain fatty acid--CoA ligase [Balneolaceae bacterium]